MSDRASRLDLMRYHQSLERGEPPEPVVSPLDSLGDGESFAYKMFLQKQQAIEDWVRDFGYNIPQHMTEERNEWLETWLKKGRITPSSSSTNGD